MLGMSLEDMQKAVINNNWKWPFTDGKMLAMRTDGRTGIFRFRGGGRPKICFYIIPPWQACPEGYVSVEFCE
jgi:hypothetical protein